MPFKAFEALAVQVHLLGIGRLWGARPPRSTLLAKAARALDFAAVDRLANWGLDANEALEGWGTPLQQAIEAAHDDPEGGQAKWRPVFHRLIQAARFDKPDSPRASAIALRGMLLLGDFEVARFFMAACPGGAWIEKASEHEPSWWAHMRDADFAALRGAGAWASPESAARLMADRLSVADLRTGDIVAKSLLAGGSAEAGRAIADALNSRCVPVQSLDREPKDLLGPPGPVLRLALEMMDGAGSLDEFPSIRSAWRLALGGGHCRVGSDLRGRRPGPGPRRASPSRPPLARRRSGMPAAGGRRSGAGWRACMFEDQNGRAGRCPLFDSPGFGRRPCRRRRPGR